MKCRRPFFKGLAPFPCGQCMPCRVARRRLWTHRLLLEQRMHSESCFVTLTYAPEHLPAGGTLVPKHFSDWLKRLRFAVRPVPIRYYGVGEYGELTWRPHYHSALFGLGPEHEEVICRTWGLGSVHVGELNAKSAAYVAGYVTKKMTSPEDPRLQGRHPEFARMSLCPGIGAAAVQRVADALNDPHGLNLISQTGDVPQTLKHGGRDMPLGRYLRRRLRDAMGFDEVGGQAAAAKIQAEELRALRDSASCSAHYQAIVPEWEGIGQLENRAKVWRKKGSL